MSTKLVIAKKSFTVAITLFLVRILFRFFLGKPMNGKKVDNSSFLHGATKGKPGKVLTAWQKRPQVHRSMIRQFVFWPTITLLILLVTHRTLALFVLAFISFPLTWYGYRKGRLIFFDPYAFTDADGIRHQQWAMKNKYRKLLRKQPIPGLVTRKTRFDPNLSAEAQEAVMASLNMHEFKGKPPVLKVTRYRRKSVRRSDR